MNNLYSDNINIVKSRANSTVCIVVTQFTGLSTYSFSFVQIVNNFLVLQYFVFENRIMIVYILIKSRMSFSSMLGEFRKR